MEEKGRIWWHEGVEVFQKRASRKSAQVTRMTLQLSML